MKSVRNTAMLRRRKALGIIIAIMIPGLIDPPEGGGEVLIGEDVVGGADNEVEPVIILLVGPEDLACVEAKGFIPSGNTLLILVAPPESLLEVGRNAGPLVEMENVPAALGAVGTIPPVATTAGVPPASLNETEVPPAARVGFMARPASLVVISLVVPEGTSSKSLVKLVVIPLILVRMENIPPKSLVVVETIPPKLLVAVEGITPTSLVKMVTIPPRSLVVAETCACRSSFGAFSPTTNPCSCGVIVGLSTDAPTHASVIGVALHCTETCVIA
ncbi:hypothetical protein BDQ17DRAFT_1546449 [Cyathus striatus]|nr:hypothetical protein BDQ17DRAFT_1546449 [Cyathus striatus]